MQRSRNDGGLRHDPEQSADTDHQNLRGGDQVHQHRVTLLLPPVGQRRYGALVRQRCLPFPSQRPAWSPVS